MRREALYATQGSNPERADFARDLSPHHTPQRSSASRKVCYSRVRASPWTDLAGLIEAFEEGDNDVAPPPFVLLAVNGGDEPFTAAMQAQVSRLASPEP